ncbi:V/A-type H+-transporting ATPase subunit E [Breznakibacter xylanolyticus]|uniref:V-type ATP synthase subunit E n=1 Tax=Breznakibacter xylanolyticus TaxID=990 RepID=A0A2W7MZK5_9BACT|nr:V-type ATP synthase subunit E family protein [Breznakibacter xylanolyticus]PZX13575.1 V/A-type H+-transporting ATPase subunit E [Breznakibacter xylanolyticus]
MQNKLQELTDRIYTEGVQKAKDEAQKIIDKANEQAAAIVTSAKTEAERTIQKATHDADEHKRNVESEVKMATEQALNALKQQMSEMVTLQVVKPSVTKLFDDKAFLQDLIIKVVADWQKSGNTNLDIMLSDKDKELLETSLKNSLGQHLHKGVQLTFSKQINAGFKVSPQGENYQIGFTDNDFINYLKTYLRPKTAKLLFEK